MYVYERERERERERKRDRESNPLDFQITIPVQINTRTCCPNSSVLMVHCWEREILKFGISLWHIDKHGVLLTAREREREREREI